jgi:hypothetical protein
MTLIEIAAFPLAEGKKSKKPKMPKQRHRDLHAALITKKGGRHYSERTDYVRAKEKSKFHKETSDPE